MNPASLVSCVEDATRGGPQTLVIIGDHQLHPAQAAVGKGSEELYPEHLGLGGAGGDPQHLALAVLIDPDGDYYGAADNPPAIAHLQIGRVEPQGGPPAFQRSAQDRITRSSISAHRRLTWLLDMRPAPIALTRSSTDRVETPWT